MTTILGKHVSADVSVHLVPGTDRVTKKPTRHVYLKSPHAKPIQIFNSVPNHWSNDKIIDHLKKTHKSKFNGFKFVSESKEEKKAAHKTVLSGGEHKPVTHNQSDGKREKIVISGPETKASVTMKIKEGRALTVAQRLQRGRQIKRIKPKMQRAAKRALSQSPSSSRIWKRSQRAARNLLKKRFSPVKGVPYAKLTTTQKIFVDRSLEKRQKLIRKVAKRLLPKVRAASFKRLQSYRAGSGISRFRNEAFETTFNQRPLPQIIESMIIDMGDHPMSDSLMTLLDLSAEKDSPAVKSLKEKASSINVPFAEILQVYADALLEYKRTGSKLSGEQYAFNAVNSYVADRKAPTINENFENMSEGLFGSMFIPPTTRLMGALSGHYPVSRAAAPRPDAYSKKDSKDEAVRSTARQSYAKSVHAETVKAAGDDPSRHKYNPNQTWSSKAKHSSHPAKHKSEVIDNIHRDVVKSYPKEYSVSPANAITAHFTKTKSQQHLAPHVQEYDKHYRRAKGLGEGVTFYESVSTKKHSGKRETDETKVHDIHWKGKKTGHQLVRVSTGATSDGDRYKLRTSSGRLSDIAMPAKHWSTILTTQFHKHEKLRSMRKAKVAESRTPMDDIIDHGITVANTLRGKGPLKRQVANVVGTTASYVKHSTKEKAKKLTDVIKNRRALHKEPE